MKTPWSRSNDGDLATLCPATNGVEPDTEISRPKKLITFKLEASQAFTTPIVPASKALPAWWKKANLTRKDAEPWEVKNIKACMPVFDAITQGYIIPLWSDVYVKVETDIETGLPFPVFRWGVQETPILEVQIKAQTEGCPAMDNALGGCQAFKFINPWLIQTPKNYSTLFVPPLNNASNLFQCFSAVVATDTYLNQVNFPFVWTGPKDWEGVIPQGTPVVQIIPFRRDDFYHEIGVISRSEQEQIDSTKLAFGQTFTNAYKKLFRKVGTSE